MTPCPTSPEGADRRASSPTCMPTAWTWRCGSARGLRNLRSRAALRGDALPVAARIPGAPQELQRTDQYIAGGVPPTRKHQPVAGVVRGRGRESAVADAGPDHDDSAMTVGRAAAGLWRGAGARAPCVVGARFGWPCRPPACGEGSPLLLPRLGARSCASGRSAGSPTGCWPSATAPACWRPQRAPPRRPRSRR